VGRTIIKAHHLPSRPAGSWESSCWVLHSYLYLRPLENFLPIGSLYQSSIWLWSCLLFECDEEQDYLSVGTSFIKTLFRLSHRPEADSRNRLVFFISIYCVIIFSHSVGRWMFFFSSLPPIHPFFPFLFCLFKHSSLIMEPSFAYNLFTIYCLSVLCLGNTESVIVQSFVGPKGTATEKSLAS
jgi:hypothetical protein